MSVFHKHASSIVRCSLMWCVHKCIANHDNNVVTTLLEYCCQCLSLYQVWSVLVFPSLSYTNMPISIVLALIRKCIIYPTNYGNLVRFLTWCCTKYSVCISVSIIELLEHASFHCSLLWYRTGIVYQQIIKTIVSNH